MCLSGEAQLSAPSRNLILFCTDKVNLPHLGVAFVPSVLLFFSLYETPISKKTRQVLHLLTYNQMRHFASGFELFAALVRT